MNRREVFKIVGLGCAALFAGAERLLGGNTKPKIQQLKMEEVVLLRGPNMDFSAETDFLEADIDDCSFFMQTARHLIAVVVDGEYVERCISANCLTNEVHTWDADDNGEFTQGRTCTFHHDKKVQILFKSKKARQEYMKRIEFNTQFNQSHPEYKNRQLLPIPLSDGASNSPVRQMLEAKFGNE